MECRRAQQSSHRVRSMQSSVKCGQRGSGEEVSNIKICVVEQQAFFLNESKAKPSQATECPPNRVGPLNKTKQKEQQKTTRKTSEKSCRNFKKVKEEAQSCDGLGDH